MTHHSDQREVVWPVQLRPNAFRELKVDDVVVILDPRSGDDGPELFPLPVFADKSQDHRFFLKTFDYSLEGIMGVLDASRPGDVPDMGAKDSPLLVLSQLHGCKVHQGGSAFDLGKGVIVAHQADEMALFVFSRPGYHGEGICCGVIQHY